MFLEQEVVEQPDVLQRLLTEQMENIRRIAQAVREFNPTFVMIAARGTSDNAARYAQYVFGAHLRLPVALATPSLHTLYECPPMLARALVIGISQSGQAEDVRHVLADARGQGALTVSITNNAESPLAHAAHHHVPLLAGEEISIAATKTYTAELTTIAMLTAALVDTLDYYNLLTRLPQYMTATLAACDSLAQTTPWWVERYRYMESFATIGRGYNYCTAFEINLKVKELCYITGDAYSEADFRHGPIATVHPGYPVIVVAPVGKTLRVVTDLLAKLQEKKAELIVISNDETARSFAHTALTIPSDVPEWLTPIIAIVPGQVFAMRLALSKGHEVDKPRGLSKVTVTE